jgi:hypothetical protein
MERLQAWWERGVQGTRRVSERVWATARDPLRVLPVLAVIALLAIGIPLTLTGLSRAGRGAMDWRHQSTIDWRSTTARVERVKIDDGLVLALDFRDRHDRRHRVDAFVGDAGGKWVAHTVPIRYDTSDPDQVELVGYGDDDPIPALLLAGAPLGVGAAAIVLAVTLWRRRALVAVSARPVQAMMRSLVVAGCLVVAGITAWAIGTVWERGWAAVASATGHLAATLFGDLLGVLVPVVAFVLGGLVTAWLARHRHHEDHDGLLSNAYRMIDRAAEMAPSPDELRSGQGARGPAADPDRDGGRPDPARPEQPAGPTPVS